jgi:Contractile injection system tube protein
MEKFKIHGFKKIDDMPGAGKVFELQINPESIKRNRAINMPSAPTGDASTQPAQFAGMGDETMDLDFIMDATGVLEGCPAFVDDLIKELTEVIFDYTDDTHKPNYLFIEYGTFSFRCMMTGFNSDYTLFDIYGRGLRAKIHLGLKKVEIETQKKSSPDMSHAFTIREGDSLPLLCKQVYGKMDYYLQVAEHNGLSNFRQLEVGSVVEFPPLQR